MAIIGLQSSHISHASVKFVVLLGFICFQVPLARVSFIHHNLYPEHFWQGSGPLFFYTGNEGPIEEFYDNSGFVYELAQDFKALIVFGEHVSSSCLFYVAFILSQPHSCKVCQPCMFLSRFFFGGGGWEGGRIALRMK